MSRSAEISHLRDLAARAQLAAGHVASAYLASPEPSWSAELKAFHSSLVEMVEGLLHGHARAWRLAGRGTGGGSEPE